MSHYNTIIKAADELQIEANKYKRALIHIRGTCRNESDPMIALKAIETLVNEALKNDKIA